jgi:hypothetical protein
MAGQLSARAAFRGFAASGQSTTSAGTREWKGNLKIKPPRYGYCLFKKAMKKQLSTRLLVSVHHFSPKVVAQARTDDALSIKCRSTRAENFVLSN